MPASTASQANSFAPLAYFKNRVKDVIRRAIPAQMRLKRSAKHFLEGGEREVHELPNLVAPGSVAVDVGAHIGDYTFALCNVLGPSGRVIAIEPLPDLANLLITATSRLKMPVTVLNCALSSKDGHADLTVPVNNGRRNAGFATLEHRSTPGKVYRVALRRLDDICRDVAGRISFMKIDVEGHELDVLRGGTEMIAKHHPNLLIEIEQRHSAVPIQQTFDFITGLGYRGEFLDADGKHIPLEQFDLTRHQNTEAVGSRNYANNFIFRPI